MEEKKDTSALEALTRMGLTPEDVYEADLELAEQRKMKEGVDRQICACGHAMARHTVTAGATYCKPARMECPCRRPRPVIEVSDTRMFIRKTDGGGASHALTRGIVAALEKNKAVEWIIDLVCDRCQKETGNVIPVPVTQNGTATQYPTGYDALLCQDCRLEV